MTGVRNYGFAISLAALALIVCSFAIQRQNGRATQTTVSNHELEILFTGAEPLLIPPDEFLSIGKVDRPQYFVDPASSGGVCAAVELQVANTNGQAIQTGHPPTAVPTPVDAIPADQPPYDEDHEDESANAAVRNVIERELSHTSREERDIWFDELKSLPAGVVRDLLQVRKQLRALPRVMGGAPEKLASIDSPPAAAQREIAAEPASQKIRFPLPDEYSATSAVETAISQLRHNLMNASTPGFKRLRVTLVDSYSPGPQGAVSSEIFHPRSSVGSSIHGEGCRVAPLLLDLKQGTLKNTGRQLDFAIEGEGFFVVRQGETELLTRCGAFTLDRDRQLGLTVTEGTVLLQPVITIPDEIREIQVSAEGTVSVLKSIDATLEIVGRLQLGRVASPARLQPQGQTLFLPTDTSGPIVTAPAMTAGLGELQQGFLEQSNVDFQAELDEIEEFMTILKAVPFPHSRPVTASGPQATPAR